MCINWLWTRQRPIKGEIKNQLNIGKNAQSKRQSGTTSENTLKW